MRLKILAALGAVSWFGLSCSTGTKSWQSPPPTEQTPAPHEGVIEPGRWVLLPDFTEADHVHETAGGARYILSNGLRLIQHPDGSLHRARDLIPLDVEPLELPSWLGGGYLFYGEQGGETSIWRAADWTDSLEPVARVTERVRAIVPGFDRLYLQIAISNRTEAIDLESGKAIDMGPLPDAPDFRSMAFADAWFGAVATDVLGAQVTFDAGASWQEVRTEGRDVRVRTVADAVVVESDRERFRLTRDGTVDRHLHRDGEALFAEYNRRLYGEPKNERSPKRRSVEAPLGRNPLRTAVLHGWPLSNEEALVAAQGGLGRVRMRDGEVLDFRSDLYPGSEPCQALALGASIGFVCHEPGGNTRLYRWQAPLHLVSVRQFAGSRIVRSSGNGGLVVEGSCADSGSASRELHSYCVGAVNGSWHEIRVQGDIGAERVATLRDGRVFVVIPPRLGAPGLLNVIQGDESEQTRLTLPAEEEGSRFLETGLWLQELQQSGEEAVSTWVIGAETYRGVEVSSQGKVRVHTPPEGTLQRTILSGRFAFEATPGQLAVTSTDFGRTWTSAEAPRGFYPLNPRTPVAALGHYPALGCSPVGCAYGPWLRVGFAVPEVADADAGTEADEGAASEAAEGSGEDAIAFAISPERVHLNQTSYFDWHARCSPTGRVGASPEELERQLNRGGAARPHRGLATGFLPQALSLAPTDVEGARASFRSFRGIAGPLVPGASLRFDTGNEDVPPFHAYAWGGQGTRWAMSAAWQVRVESGFELDGVWATAPTYAPWSDGTEAAELFGAQEGARNGADWGLELDPEEQDGVLRIASPVSTQFHLLSKGKAIQSYGSVDAARIAGAVRVNGKWFIGQREGNDLRLVQLTASGPEVVETYFVDSSHKAQIVRSTDGHRVGVLVRTAHGSWHIYPLSSAFRPEPPLGLSREVLNQSPPVCATDDGGWWVNASTPLTSWEGRSRAWNMVFTGDAEEWKARSVRARTIVREGELCVYQLSATLAGTRDALSLPHPEPGTPRQPSVPMIVTADELPRRVEFRCVL